VAINHSRLALSSQLAPCRGRTGTDRHRRRHRRSSEAAGVPRLAEERADIFCVGTQQAVPRANVGVVPPHGVAEELSPVLEILPLQQLALHLAVARQADPDAPRGLRKVTETP
jgi:fructoselysine-6-P-deglycase FrlB-like protein